MPPALPRHATGVSANLGAPPDRRDEVLLARRRAVKYAAPVVRMNLPMPAPPPPGRAPGGNPHSAPPVPPAPRTTAWTLTSECDLPNRRLPLGRPPLAREPPHLAPRPPRARRPRAVHLLLAVPEPRRRGRRTGAHRGQPPSKGDPRPASGCLAAAVSPSTLHVPTRPDRPTLAPGGPLLAHLGVRRRTQPLSPRWHLCQPRLRLQAALLAARRRLPAPHMGLRRPMDYLTPSASWRCCAIPPPGTRGRARSPSPRNADSPADDGGRTGSRRPRSDATLPDSAVDPREATRAQVLAHIGHDPARVTGFRTGAGAMGHPNTSPQQASLDFLEEYAVAFLQLPARGVSPSRRVERRRGAASSTRSSGDASDRLDTLEWLR